MAMGSHKVLMVLCLLSSIYVSFTATINDRALSPEIKDVLGKTLDFSYLIPYTGGVKLTLAGKVVNFNAFTVDKSNANHLDRMLRKRDFNEFMKIAAVLTGIEVKLAAKRNKPITTLAMEYLLDTEDCTVLSIEDVKQMAKDITEDSSITNLEKQSGPHIRNKRKATTSASRQWSTTIPYRISSYFDNVPDYYKAIKDGIQHWEEETCLVFRDIRGDNVPSSYISFIDDYGCYSYVGKRSIGTISIGNNCGTKAIVAHEIGHALGFHHEQSRPDRDLYIRVLEGNLPYGTSHNFLKRSWREALTEGIPYDYSSVMHYPEMAFGYHTISALEEGMERVVGSRSHLSFYDVKLANMLYCYDRCPQGLTWSVCQNDGYRDPKDCSRCKCPDGWTGQYCTEVKQGVNAVCGANELTASESWQIIKSPMYNAATQFNNTECTWHIKSPGKNQRIVLRFQGRFNFPYCNSATITCQDYIEVRNKDMAKAGRRFCCSPGSEITSQGNGMLILLRSKTWRSENEFTLEYKVESCGCPSGPSLVSIPACIETQSYPCNANYSDCSHGPCLPRIQYNTCYKDVKTCCEGFQLRRNTCYITDQWSAWYGWSGCSRTCGSGTRNRYRSCQYPPCKGPPTDTVSCNSHICPVLARSGWTEWAPWTSCSRTCGTGFHARKRTCENLPCSGDGFQVQTCYNYCNGDVWSGWSSCSRSCGSGIRTRGSGSLTDQQNCNTQPCMKVCSYQDQCGGGGGEWWFVKQYCTRYRLC